MGGNISVHNKTDHTWTICIELAMCRRYKFVVKPRQKQSGCYSCLCGDASLKVRRGNCTKEECCENPNLWYEFNPTDEADFTIQESRDRQEIHLHCSKRPEKILATCKIYDPSPRLL